MDVYRWKPEMGDDVVPVSEIQESLRKNTDLLEDWYGYWDEEAQEIASELIKEADQEEVEEDWDSVYEQVYEMMDTNGCLEHILPNALFVYDPDELEILDYTTEDEDNEERQWLRERATEESCFTFEDVKEVILNSSGYGGQGGVGVIIDSEDMARILRTAGDTPLEVVGTPILYVRDGLNGSGHYVMAPSKESHILKFEKKSDIRLDYGKYSLGAVFGTDEWTWR